MDSQLKTLADTLATELLSRDKASAETVVSINALSRPDFLAMSGYLVGTQGHFLPDTLPCLVEYLRNTYLSTEVASMMLAGRLGLAPSLRTLCFENDPELVGLNCVLKEAALAGQMETTKIMLVAIHDKLKYLGGLTLPEGILEKTLQGQRQYLTELADRLAQQPELPQTLSHFASSI